MADHRTERVDVYRRLARALDAIPNGFPATPDGAELRFLKHLFTQEQAVLGGMMTTTPEAAAAIAERAGVDARSATRTLKTMVREGLIQMQRGEADGRRQILFALMPFVVGFYEAQLPRMDAEMAAAFESYFQASGGLDMPGPSVHRVIPVGAAVQDDVEIHPYEQAAALIEDAKSWGVRDCICRTQQHLVGEGCDAPVENCLVFAPVEGAFDGSQVDRAITKAEALTILAEAEDAGLVHTVGNQRAGNHYICNCCTCCCGVLRRVAEFRVPTAIARAAFRAAVDEEVCIGCGACVERCQFDALSLTEAATAAVDDTRCVGCGLCASACPVDALALTRRPDDEVPAPPADFPAWSEARRAARGAG